MGHKPPRIEILHLPVGIRPKIQNKLKTPGLNLHPGLTIHFLCVE